MQSFSYAGSPARIVFGPGRRADIAAELEALGRSRALVLTTPGREAEGRAIAESLGEGAVGLFPGAIMHTPVPVTEAAVAEAESLSADCIVSFGGGSSIGLGKAIAYRTGLDQIVLPTTYSGSEATSILGQTEDGEKKTLRDPQVLPEVVIYDPELTLGLPVPVSVTSGLNAMAHAAEALYAHDRDPISSLMAAEGLAALRQALPAIIENPGDLEARGNALYGAWLCGTVLGHVAMSLHHKLCHVLGGTFDTPHAETHAIMLPHTVGFNAGAVPELLAPVAELFEESPGAALYDFAASIGAPSRLADLGLSEDDLDRAAEVATRNPYSNPRPFDREAIRGLLQEAWEGRRPAI